MKKIKVSRASPSSNGAIIYPTDTIWGLGCNTSDRAAIHKIFKIKNRPDSKSHIILVYRMAMPEQYEGSIPYLINYF